jgi:hypothetical protein
MSVGMCNLTSKDRGSSTHKRFYHTSAAGYFVDDRKILKTHAQYRLAEGVLLAQYPLPQP